MIIVDPVVETYSASDFTAWPIGDLPAGNLLRVSGGLTSADVGTVMAVIATGVDGVADPDAMTSPLLQRMIETDCLIAPGGLRVHDSATGVTMNPGCCSGLETWRAWRDVIDGHVPWLGHSPSPWIEHLGQSIRIWPSGGEQAAPPEGASPIEITTTELPDLINTAHLQLLEFLDLVEPWAFALGEPRAHELASAIDRHFHITEASIREE